MFSLVQTTCTSLGGFRYFVFLCVVIADNQQFDTSDGIRIEADDVLLEEFSSGSSEVL